MINNNEYFLAVALMILTIWSSFHRICFTKKLIIFPTRHSTTIHSRPHSRIPRKLNAAVYPTCSCLLINSGEAGGGVRANITPLD